jgi:type II secretory pathway component PulM
MATLSSPLKSIDEALSRMSPRERSLVAALGVSIAALFLLVGGYIIYSRLDDLEDSNSAMRQALRDIERKRGAYLQARTRSATLEGRIGTTPLSLSGYLEQIAKDTGVEVRETNPRTPEKVGKKYIQQSIDVRLSKVQLEPLVKFMRKLEQSPSNLVMVTQLSVRARDDKHVDFDVDMTVSTYEHAPKKQKSQKDGKADDDSGAETPAKEPS